MNPEPNSHMQKLVMGNEAVALGAIAAGCDFFAGYPITPATEILEDIGKMLPPRGGVFLQMEDELSAMAAVIGAAWARPRSRRPHASLSIPREVAPPQVYPRWPRRAMSCRHTLEVMVIGPP